jgi:hypothetical protein
MKRVWVPSEEELYHRLVIRRHRQFVRDLVRYFYEIVERVTGYTNFFRDLGIPARRSRIPPAKDLKDLRPNRSRSEILLGLKNMASQSIKSITSIND